MLVSILVFLSLVSGLYYYASTSKKILPNGSRPLPRPKGLPIFGNIFQVGLEPYLTFNKWAKMYGPIFQVQLGVKRWVIISDPNIAHELLVKRGANYSNRDKTVVMNEIVHPESRGVLASSGDYWRKMRRIVHHAMSQRAVESYTPLIEIESIETMRQLFDATIDPEGSFHRGTLGVIHTVIYGKRLETSDDLVVKDLLKYILDTFQVIEADAVVNLLPFLQCLPIGLDKKAKKIMDGYFSLTKKLFDKFKEDKKCGITQPCVAEYILEHMEEEGIDDFDVHNLFIDLFGGGLDTSAVTLSWITAILALHPIVQERAHAELDAMVGRDRLPNQADEANLPFIRAIIREVLRFRPPIGWLNFPHQSVQDDTYEGYHIPADTSIVINVHAMHMDSSRWTHPERFDPDRYLDMTESIPASANGPIAKRDNMAFGWGRRMCPGIFLAEAELFMGTALLLWSYRIEVEKGGKAPNINEWQSGIVMRPKPYKVSFIPRHDKVKELIFA